MPMRFPYFSTALLIFNVFSSPMPNYSHQ
uniref:Uncharacterized protein LOC103435836 isoform X2 n=1 Tax=Rhizophora mucronata TaxID=61149 RepID=A0A2P2LA74_RHIMU